MTRRRTRRVFLSQLERNLRVSSLPPRDAQLWEANCEDTALGRGGRPRHTRARAHAERGERVSRYVKVRRRSRRSDTARGRSLRSNRVVRRGDASTSRSFRTRSADKEIRYAGGETPRRAPRGEVRIVRYPVSSSEGRAETKPRGPRRAPASPDPAPDQPLVWDPQTGGHRHREVIEKLAFRKRERATRWACSACPAEGRRPTSRWDSSLKRPTRAAATPGTRRAA